MPLTLTEEIKRSPFEVTDLVKVVNQREGYANESRHSLRWAARTLPPLPPLSLPASFPSRMV